ncbi:MAG: hypothetical protein PBV00_07105 [Pseudomonas asiatica]
MDARERQQLEKLINSHAADIADLKCALFGVIQQLKQAQGEEAVSAAYEKATELAKGTQRGMNIIAGNPARIAKYFGIDLK